MMSAPDHTGVRTTSALTIRQAVGLVSVGVTVFPSHDTDTMRSAGGPVRFHAPAPAACVYRIDSMRPTATALNSAELNPPTVIFSAHTPHLSGLPACSLPANRAGAVVISPFLRPRHRVFAHSVVVIVNRLPFRGLQPQLNYHSLSTQISPWNRIHTRRGVRGWRARTPVYRPAPAWRPAHEAAGYRR